MVLVPVWGIGYVFLQTIANDMFFKASNLDRELALSPEVFSDTAKSAMWERTANAQTSLGLRFGSVGIGLWLLTIPMIWWWLSARRRKDLPGI